MYTENIDVNSKVSHLRTRQKIPLLLSVLAICSCVFGLYRLCPDLIYFFRSPDPIPTTLRMLPKLPQNSYVQISGKANYTRSALVEGRYSGFDHIFEVTEVSSKNADSSIHSANTPTVFIEKNRKQRVSKAELKPIISGRLLKFSDRVYASNLTHLFSKEPTASASIDANTLVIIANLKPREHWLRLSLAILLLSMITFNLYALSRAIKEPRKEGWA